MPPTYYIPPGALNSTKVHLKCNATISSTPNATKAADLVWSYSDSQSQFQPLRDGKFELYNNRKRVCSQGSSSTTCIKKLVLRRFDKKLGRRYRCNATADGISKHLDVSLRLGGKDKEKKNAHFLS